MKKFQPSDLSGLRFSATDKVTKIYNLATTAFAHLKNTLLVSNSGSSYEPSLLERLPRNVVMPATKAYLEQCLLELFGTYEPASIIKREIMPLVMSLLAKHEMVNLRDIRPFMFKSETGGEGVYTWHRLAFDADPNASKVEEYETMRGRTSPDAFRAQTEFLGSILEYGWTTEQYLHISGAGNDGKSSLLAAILSALPKDFSVSVQSNDLTSSHGLAKIEGKRVLVFSEENSSSFMSSGRFKQLTGRDPISVNPKNQAEREVVPNCRIIVTSNSRPQVSGQAADMRRIIPVFYSSFGGGTMSDQGWSQRLIQRGPEILQYCHAQFVRNVQVTGGQRISPDAEFSEALQEASTITEMHAMFEELFEASDVPEHWMTTQEAIAEIARKVRDRGERQALKQYLYGLERFRGRQSPTRVRQIKGWVVRDVAHARTMGIAP